MEPVVLSSIGPHHQGKRLVFVNGQSSAMHGYQGKGYSNLVFGGQPGCRIKQLTDALDASRRPSARACIAPAGKTNKHRAQTCKA
jgi:hypothetical protein